MAPLGHEAAPRGTTIIGSLSSSIALSRSLRGVTYLVHAAALKDITYCESHPLEAIDTNVTGTQNVVNETLHSSVERAVFVSTDKAAAPTTLYGATKLLGERLWLGAQTYTGGGSPDFVAVRYGNVWGSARSVLHAFERQRTETGSLTITDPKATRFHITIQEASDLVLRVLHEAKRGTLWVPKLPTYSVGDLAQAFMNVHGITRPAQVVGLRPSEKLHEDLVSFNETPQVLEEAAGGFVIDPRHVGSPRPAYSSGDRSRQLSVQKLEQEIRTWQSAVQAAPKTLSPNPKRS